MRALAILVLALVVQAAWPASGMAAYKVVVLSLSQENLNATSCEHVLRFRVLQDGNPLSGEQLRAIVPQLGAVGVQSSREDKVSDRAFRDSPDKAHPMTVDDQDPTAVKAVFTNRSYWTYYHYRAEFQASLTDTVFSEGRVCMNSGFDLALQAAEKDWKKTIYTFASLGTWSLLAATFVAGAGAFLRVRRRFRVQKNELNRAPEITAIEADWNSLADAEHAVMREGGKQWTEAMTAQAAALTDRIQALGDFPIRRILLAGLDNHRVNMCHPMASQEIDRAMSNESEFEANALRGRGVDVLRQLSYVAPAIGLLGTVLGLSGAFHNLGELPTNPGPTVIIKVMGNDFSLALWTTIVGLLESLVFTAGVVWFLDQVKVTIARWQATVLAISRRI